MQTQRYCLGLLVDAREVFIETHIVGDEKRLFPKNDVAADQILDREGTQAGDLRVPDLEACVAKVRISRESLDHLLRS